MRYWIVSLDCTNQEREIIIFQFTQTAQIMGRKLLIQKDRRAHRTNRIWVNSNWNNVSFLTSDLLAGIAVLRSFLTTCHPPTQGRRWAPYPMRATRGRTYSVAWPSPRGNMALLSASTSATLGGSWRTAVPEGFSSEMAERNMAPAVSMKSEWFMLLHWNRQTNLWKLTQTRPIKEPS